MISLSCKRKISQMAAGKSGCIRDVEQSCESVPLGKSEWPFGQHVSELVVFVSTHFTWTIGSRWIRSHNRSSATLWSRKVSHRRTPAFDDHLDHCITILENEQQDCVAGNASVLRDDIEICSVLRRKTFWLRSTVD